MQGTPKKTSKAKLDWLRATANIDIFAIKRPKDCRLKDGTAHATAVQELEQSDMAIGNSEPGNA